jgi:hypothetical protein
MGFELNRIMQQYGVGTPGKINYSGAAAPVTPVEPKAPPVGSDEATSGLYPGAQTKYQADLAAYPELMRKYQLDKDSYDAYGKEYQTRLMNTPMYMQSQFQTGYEPKSAGLQFATRPDVNVATGSGMGLKQFNTNIQDYATKNPNAYSDAINAYADKYGISGQDIFNATQNRWGNVLQAPKYGPAFTPTATVTAPVTAPVTSIVGGGGNDEITLGDYVKKVDDKIIDDRIIDPPIIDDPVIDNPVVDDRKVVEQVGTEIVETPSIYTKPIVSDISDTVDTNIPLIIPETALELPDFTVEKPKEDKSFFDDPDLVDVGPSRGLIKNQEELPEEFDKYLVNDNAFNLDGSYDFRGSDYNFGGSGGGGKYFDDQNMATMAFAKGGQVKTHYQTAGSVQLPSGYGSLEEEADFLARQERDRAPVEISPVDMSNPPPPMISTRTEAEPVNAPLATIAMNEAPVAPAVVAAPKPPPVAPPAFGSERMGNIQALLAAYGPKDGAYGEDLKAARASAKAESDAFAKMLSSAMKSPEDEKSSKAEMYFRLASAFGAPTKTGHFAENLGLVGKELGEYSKNKRASAQQKLALALEGQKMKMTAAKEDLNTLRSLAGEEMKDKRAIATELIKDYIKSGEPQSSAGKQAKDEGLTPGTPEYQKRVEALGNMNIESKLAQITASLAGVNTAAANLALAQEKFKNQQTQQAKLTGPELKLKTETEETLAQTDQALTNLKKAYALNPNTFDTSLIDAAQRKLLEAGGSKDPKVIATRELENLLEKAALSQLKATFPGAISNDERKALQDVQGLSAKSKEERALIMKNAYTALKTVSERHRKRLNEINSGLYRDTAAPALEGGNE